MSLDDLVASARRRLHAAIDARCAQAAWDAAVDQLRTRDELAGLMSFYTRSHGQRWRFIRAKLRGSA